MSFSSGFNFGFNMSIVSNLFGGLWMPMSCCCGCNSYSRPFFFNPNMSVSLWQYPDTIGMSMPQINASVPGNLQIGSWGNFDMPTASFGNITMPPVSWGPMADTFIPSANNTNTQVKLDDSDILKNDSVPSEPQTSKKQVKQVKQVNQVTNNGGEVDYSNAAKSLKAKWGKKAPHLTAGFYNKLVDICKRQNCSPYDLMALMNSETAGSFKASQKCGLKNASAVGLIQFTGDTPRMLGTSRDALLKMTEEEQLDYVEKFIVSAKKTAGISASTKIDAGTLYALIFMPANARNEVLCQRGSKAYSWNPLLDKDKNGAITKTDLGNIIRSMA